METFNIDLIPGRANPVCHASQFDKGRTFRVNLFEGSSVYTLDGTETLSVIVKKPDGNMVVETITNTGDSYIEFATTEQMTACAGSNLCELRIENGTDLIGTLNFILECEPSPDTGIQSASEIDNLETQVNGFVVLAVADQYDSANVIFDNAPTAGHGVPYTVTSDGIQTALDAKADTASLASVATSGSYSDLTGTPNLATVATSGNYSDLTGKPTFTDITSLVTFADTPGGSTRFYHKDGALYINYMSGAGTHSANDLLFTLPSGYRPPQTELILPFIKNANAYGNVKITNTDGKCVVNVISNTTVSGRVYFNAVIVL